MDNDAAQWDRVERRSKSRKKADRSHSVEIQLPGVPVHQFKLRDVSLKGAAILIKESSSILKHLNEGQELNVKYYTTDKTKPQEILNSEIKHITKVEDEPFFGHYLVGISILRRQNQP